MGKKDNGFNNPFEGLGKALKAKGFTGKPDLSADISGQKKSDPDKTRKPEKKDPRTDEQIFLDAMNGITEIPSFRDISVESPSHKFKGASDADSVLNELRDIVDGKSEINIADIDEYDEWTPPGGSAGLTRKLHKGECAIQDHIDLHGLIEDEAEIAFVEFIEDSRQQGFSCVKVIHGRGLRSPGEPVLKNMVSRLLKGALSKHVRAYATAPPKDGGLGATYILLRHG